MSNSIFNTNNQPNLAAPTPGIDPSALTAMMDPTVGNQTASINQPAGQHAAINATATIAKPPQRQLGA